jgi:hypothetical protein
MPALVPVDVSSSSNENTHVFGMCCQLWWCNQIPLKVEYRPFTPEEDQIIIISSLSNVDETTTLNHRMDGREKAGLLCEGAR